MLRWLNGLLSRIPVYRRVARVVAARLGHDPREHPLLTQHRGLVHSHWVAFLLSWGVLVIGVWTALDQDHLEESTKLAACVAWLEATELAQSTTTPRGPLPRVCTDVPGGGGGRSRLAFEHVTFDIDTFAFWIVIWILTMALSARLRADDRKQDERARGLLHAVHRSPDPNVVRYYPDWFADFRDALFDDYPDDHLPQAQRRVALARNIRSATWIIGAMARQFARAVGARYGVNVMIYLRNDPQNPQHFPPELLKTLRFHEPNAVATFEALLHLPDDLLVEDIDQTEHDRAQGAQGADNRPANEADEGVTNGRAPSSRTVPLISLAVLQPNDATTRYDLVIPGAPTAVVHEAVCGLSVHEDTRRIAEDCAAFDRRVRDRVAQYFAPDGEGADIASFASWRIGTRSAPVGVLNVDSDRASVLGTDAEFYVTFSALVTPMLGLLELAVEDYRALVAEELHLPDVALTWSTENPETVETAGEAGAAAPPANAPAVTSPAQPLAVPLTEKAPATAGETNQ